jgi:hypothetical protein
VSERRSFLLVVATLGALALVLYGDVVLGGYSFCLRDHLQLTIPAHAFIRESLLAGHLPEWWDRVGFGIPFASSPVNQGLSPVGWAFSLLPQPFGADAEPVFLLWVFSAGVAFFTYRLRASAVSALFAGALATCSGYMASLIPNGAMPYVAPLPWLAWAADRLATSTPGSARARAALVLALVVAVQLLAPEPVSVITALLVAGGVLLIRSGTNWLPSLGWAAVSCVGGLGLAAFSVIPAVLLAAGSERAGGIPFDIATYWSLEPARLVELVWPHLLGNPTDQYQSLAWGVVDLSGPHLGQSWSYSVFVGLPAVVLAGIGVSRIGWLRWLTLASVLAVLALGRHTPVAGVLHELVPLARFGRYPEKHVLGVLFLVWVFAGVGLGELLELRRAWLWLGLSTAAMAVAVGTAGLFAEQIRQVVAGRVADSSLWFPVDVPGGIHVALGYGVAAVASGAIATLGAWLTRVRPRIGGGLLALGVLALAFTDARSVTVTTPRERPAPLLARQIPSGARVLRPDRATWGGTSAVAYALKGFETLGGNVAAHLGLRVVPGYSTPVSDGASHFWNDVYGIQTQLHPEEALRSFAALLGVDWAIVDQFATPPGLTASPIGRSSGFALIWLPGARPHAFVTSGWVPVSSRKEALHSLGAPRHDPRVVAIEGARAPDSEAAHFHPCGIARSAARVDVTCDSLGGFLVVLDELSPGWTATVDGEPVFILRADGLFRAVYLSTGFHRVAFRYRTPGLDLGMTVSAVVALALILAKALLRSAD